MNSESVSRSDVQSAEFKILCEFKKVCDKHSLKYFLCGGTLLGAVRHKGFIPWDDDIDIAMPYQDYLKFLSLAQQELGDLYFVQNSETEDNYPSPFTKIRMNNTTFLDSAFSAWHIHHGIWIDIFPIISMTPNRLRVISRILKVCKVMQMDDLINSNPKEFTKLYGEKRIKLLKVFYQLFPLRLRKRMHRIMLKWICSYHRGSYCSELIGSTMYLWPKEVFSSSTQMLFEGMEFSAPADYKKYLEIHYGDYMKLPPESQRIGTHADIIDLHHSIDNIRHLYQ